MNPVEPVPPKPRNEELRKIYRGLISISRESRIAALSSALIWYDGAIAYLVHRKMLDPRQPGINWQVASDQRRNARYAETLPTKEGDLEAAVINFERACHKLRPVSILPFQQEFRDKEETLLAQKEKLEKRFGRVIELLQKAVGPRLSLQLSDAPREAQHDSFLTSINYNRKAAKEMTKQLRKEGLLAVFVSQLPTLARHLTLLPDGRGGWTADESKLGEAYHSLLYKFVHFAKTSEAPRTLVKLEKK